MFKFIALYEEPDDAEAFEAHYRTTHLEICRQWPGLRSANVTKVLGTARGGEAPLHLIGEFVFDSRDDFMAAMSTDSGRESQQDARRMAEQFGVKMTMLLGADFE